MLDNLTNRFYTVFRNIRGQARLDEENIKPALREVRLALLEAQLNPQAAAQTQSAATSETPETEASEHTE